MRRTALYAIPILAACASILIARAAPSWPAPPRIQAQQAAPTQDAPQEPMPRAPAQTPPPPTHLGPLIILDPGHGGSDPGARGPNGALEKETALMIARIVRIELERQGYRVVMTRNDDTNPSYDDRAAIANAHREAIFISIHVSSTGTNGTAHTYYYQFASPVPVAAGSDSTPSPAPQAGGLPLWEEAQQPYTEASRHFADILEVQLAQRLPGTPAISSAAAVRELRSIALPAVAVELSSMNVSDSRTLISMAPPLATSIVKSLEALHAATPQGNN